MTDGWTLLARDLPVVAAAGDTGGLSQPWATVIAAAIAILGAVGAFLGVTITTRTTRRENRRSEKVRVLGDAWTAVVKYCRALERVNKIDDPNKRVARINEMSAGPMWELSDDYVVAATKLPIYKFGVAYRALSKLHAELITIWEAMLLHPVNKVDEKRATDLYNDAERAIKEAIEDLK